MKTLKDLDTHLVHFEEDLPIDTVAQLPTYRKMYKAALGMVSSKNGEEAIDLYQVGLKLKLNEPQIDLEDAEFKLLKEACAKNPVQWMAHYHAQVVLKLKEAEQLK